MKSEYPRYPGALPTGGILLKDEGNVIPKAFNDIITKLGKQVVKGEFKDMLKNPAPAYIHYHQTFLDNAAKDL